MTTCLGKSCLIYVFSYFPFSFEGRMWDLIVSVPDHCLSFTLNVRDTIGNGNVKARAILQINKDS